MHYFEEKLNIILTEATAAHTFKLHIEKAAGLLKQLDEKDKIYLSGDNFFELHNLINDTNELLTSVFDPNDPKTEPYYSQIADMNATLRGMLDACSPRTFKEAITTGYIEVLQDAYERIEETITLASKDVDFVKYPNSKRLINIFIVVIRHINRALDAIVSFAHDQARQRNPQS